MGVPLLKHSCTINNQFVLNNLTEIEQSNSDLNFRISNSIPNESLNSFIEQQTLIKEYLKEEYNEDIEEYSIQYFNDLNNGAVSTFIKRFAIITDSNNNIIGRLDCTKEKNIIRLETLYVSSEYRGKKLGLWLVGKLMLHCKVEFSDIKLFETNTDHYNDGALKILKKYNFYVKCTIDELIKNRQ